MRNAHKLAFVLVVLFCVSGYAQDEKAAPPKEEPKPAAKETLTPLPVYRIEFTVSEVEGGKRLNTRSYTVMAEDRQNALTVMSTRVPVATSTMQFQYMDVGLKFTLNPHESGNQVVLGGNFEMTSLVPGEAPAEPNTDSKPGVHPPVVRTVHTDFKAALQPGKQSTLALLDDVTSKKQYQLEATVTKIK